MKTKKIAQFKHEERFSHILRCENHWMDNWVFIAGFGKAEYPRKSSMMAYGTILDYTAFDKAWETIKDDYSVDCWKEMCKYWIYQHYLSFIPVIMVCQIYRKLGIKYEIVDGKFKEITEVTEVTEVIA